MLHYYWLSMEAHIKLKKYHIYNEKTIPKFVSYYNMNRFILFLRELAENVSITIFNVLIISYF